MTDEPLPKGPWFKYFRANRETDPAQWKLFAPLYGVNVEDEPPERSQTMNGQEPESSVVDELRGAAEDLRLLHERDDEREAAQAEALEELRDARAEIAHLREQHAMADITRVKAKAPEEPPKSVHQRYVDHEISAGEYAQWRAKHPGG